MDVLASLLTSRSMVYARCIRSYSHLIARRIAHTVVTVTHTSKILPADVAHSHTPLLLKINFVPH